MSYELVPLGELGEIVAGSTPDTNNQKYWGGDIAWITPADLTNHEGIYFTGNLRKITEEGYRSCSTKMLPAGSILFSSRAPIGHCAVTSFPLCTNQGFKSIIPNERLDAVYGFFALKFFTPQIEALGRGATFAEVNKEIFENFAIPLPPLTEQKRIASLLARADRLRHLRRTAHELGESLLQSVFLEMFGDITRNEKGWKSQRLEELCDEITVGYVGPMASEYTQSGVLFLRSQNIKPFRIDLNDVKYVSPEFHKKLKKSAIHPGNVVVVRTGLAGTAAVVPDNFPETNCSDLVIIRPSSKINNQYLTMLFNSTWGKGHVEGNAVGQIQQHFNIGSANEMKVPLPPLSLQEEFAGVVARVESLRKKMSEGERQVEGLFESLLAESFG